MTNQINNKDANQIGEWMQAALAAAEETCAGRDVDRFFIGYFLKSLDLAGVPGAAQVSDRLLQLAIDVGN